MDYERVRVPDPALAGAADAPEGYERVRVQNAPLQTPEGYERVPVAGNPANPDYGVSPATARPLSGSEQAGFDTFLRGRTEGPTGPAIELGYGVGHLAQQYGEHAGEMTEAARQSADTLAERSRNVGGTVGAVGQGVAWLERQLAPVTGAAVAAMDWTEPAGAGLHEPMAGAASELRAAPGAGEAPVTRSRGVDAASPPGAPRGGDIPVEPVEMQPPAAKEPKLTPVEGNPFEPKVDVAPKELQEASAKPPEQAASSSLEVPPSGGEAPASPLPSRIADTIRDLGGSPQMDSVRLNKLREALPDVPREDLDAELTRMHKSGELNLMNLDNPRDIQAVGDAALKHPSGDLHTAWLTDKNPQPQPREAGAAVAPLEDIHAQNLADQAPTPRTLGGALKYATETVQGIFAPVSLDRFARMSEGNIREQIGAARRLTSQAEAAFDSVRTAVDRATPGEHLDIIDLIERRSQMGHDFEHVTSETVREVMRQTADLYDSRHAMVQALDNDKDVLGFIEDYYSHQWRDPEVAKRALGDLSGQRARQGSGGFTRERTVPTIAEGIRAGLVPLSLNPIETVLRYVQNVDRYVATRKIIQAGEESGVVRYLRPESGGIGVSSVGQWLSKVPEGWEPLQGAVGQRNGMQAYAPRGFATIYNNFVSKGIEGFAGRVVRGMQMANNAITAAELGFSGFHAFTMAHEAYVSGIANAIDKLMGGNVLGASAELALSPLKPITSAIRGSRFQKIYLGKDTSGGDWKQIVDLFTEAGGRAIGRDTALDEYRYARTGVIKAWKDGTLRAEAMEAKNQPFTKGPLLVMKTVGHALQTLSGPLFDWYIPRVKNGAFYDMMKTWLDNHSDASHLEQVAAAREIVDTVDNRFGEMIQDNIFWNRTMKQAAQLSMLSYSWTMGTIREIGGGARDIAMSVPRKANLVRRVGDRPALTGREAGAGAVDASRLSDTYRNPDAWSRKASYALALPIGVGIMGAVATKLLTGKNPSGWQDLMAPPTGGQDTHGAGKHRRSVPERALTPGYQKDVMGWYMDALQEAANKRSPLLKLIGDLATNKDWRGDPLARSDAGIPGWVVGYLGHIAGAFTPISVSSMGQAKRGSAIGPVQRALGIKPAPMYLSDPEGYAKMKAAMAKRADKAKVRHDRNAKVLQE